MTYAEFLRTLAATDDSAFAEYVSGLRFPPHLREAYRFAARNRRSVILLPRGHAKTTGAIHHLARRVGETEGRIKIGIATASEPDALKRSRAVRAMVEDARFAEVFPWARGGVESRKWSEGEWTVAGAEGYAEKDATVRAGSLLSLKPGPRFDLLLADDLIGPDECTTAAQRQRTADRFWSVIAPMVVPTGQVIVLGTRWHGDDLYAELAAKGWPVHLRRALDPDGDALWPDYWSAARLRAQRDQMGGALFDLQYQNDPTGHGRQRHPPRLDPLRRCGARGRPARRRRPRRVGEGAGRLHRGGRGPRGPHDQRPLRHRRLARAARRGPPGVAHRGRRCREPRPGRDGPRLVASVRLFESVNVEATAYQNTFVRELLGHTHLPVRAITPDRDKVTRARALAARYEGGKVFHLRGAPGMAELEAEIVGFPNAEHDDLVDALVYAADLGRIDFSFA